MMLCLLRPVLHEGAVGSSFLTSPKIILVIVVNERSVCVDESVGVWIKIGLWNPVLVVQNHIRVSIYTLDADAEAICTRPIILGPRQARQLSVALLLTIVRNASHSVGLHQECRRNKNPSPWIRWPAETRGSERLSMARYDIIDCKHI